MKIWNILVCVWIGVMRAALPGNAELVLTSSSLTARDGEPFTLICRVSSGSAVTIPWLQNKTWKVITQLSNNCTKQPPPMGNNNISRFSVSCSDTVHSIEFRFNSSTDQGGWQCGMYVNDTYIYPRSNIHSVGVASPVTSTQSSSTTTYMETTSESGTVTPQNVVSSSVTSTQSSGTTTRYMETTSEPGTVTPQTGVASPVTSSQSSSTTTWYMETTSGPEAVTPQKVSTDDGDTETIYIMVGAVGGGVLLVVVVVGIVCIRRRRQAARATFVLKYQKEDIKGETNVTAAQVYQNAANCDVVENELYRLSRDISPINEGENQKDDFIMSDAYAVVDMPATSTRTPREQGASCDVDVDNLYAKPDKSRSSNVQQVSDIYAVVKKPKKKRQDDPKVSEDVNTGDVYAKPNKA